MPNPIKEQIKNDLNQAKETGQLRAGRIREIVQAAVFQVASEVKEGSGELRTIVKDAVSTVIENLQDKGGEIKEEVAASIEGAIEGVDSFRRKTISKTQEEVKQLQAKLDTEENQHDLEIEGILSDLEETGKNESPNIKASIESAINTIKNSEEVSDLQKRYAQLQAQAAILRANLAARYGGRYEEVKQHLDEAKDWYEKVRPEAQVAVDQAEQKRQQLEERFGEAGTALAKKERQVRRILSELLKSAADLLREKEPPAK